MSSRVEILSLIVKSLKREHWVAPAYEIFNLSFIGTYESLDDFLWDASIEATHILLPSLDLGPETQYTDTDIETLIKLTVNYVSLKTQYSLASLVLNHGR